MPSWYRDPDAPEPNRPTRIDAVALIERDGALLLDRRMDDGTWALVGGAVEADQTVVEALIREGRPERVVVE